MAVELAVRTSLIRQAADILDDASGAFNPGWATEMLVCPLTDGSLGSSAAAREVVVAASRRVRQSTEAARSLAALASTTAEKLRSAANAFDAVESSMIAPPR